MWLCVCVFLVYFDLSNVKLEHIDVEGCVQAVHLTAASVKSLFLCGPSTVSEDWPLIPTPRLLDRVSSEVQQKPHVLAAPHGVNRECSF